MTRRRIIPVIAVAAALAGCGSRVHFQEGFEEGPGQWEVRGSMVLTTVASRSGSHSQTFTSPALGGDAFTSTFPVTPGRTYYLHAAHMSLGGAGFIGIDLITQDPVTIREQWLIGESSEALSQFEGQPGVWKVYSQSYTIPDNVTRIRIKTEDTRSNLRGDGGVYFDDIEWSSDPEPSL